jgi:hypothetical protein
VARQPAISFSISFQHPFNRAGGRTFNVMPMKSATQIRDAVASLAARPEAIQALWDGDTTGWMVWIDAVYKAPTYRTENIAVLRDDGGDLRLFTGSVPPWPEAQVASAAGALIEAELKIPFYFPSPTEPEDDCPSWAERHLGRTCKTCEKLLLQDSSLPWVGYCYQCHLKREREKSKEA